MTRARTLADMISDGVIGTTELADDVITPVLLDETGSYTMAQLGIGGSATMALHVQGSSYPYVRITNSGYTGLDVGQADAGEGGAGLIKLRDSTPLLFYTADLERMRIDQNGNVGIGTQSTSDAALSIQDSGSTNIKFTSNEGGYAMIGENDGGDIYIQADDGNTSANSKIVFQVDDSEKLRIDNNGTLALGTIPSSSWSSGYDAFQFGQTGSLYGHGSATTPATYLSSNVVYEGVAPGYNDLYLTTGAHAFKYAQDYDKHYWSVAGTGTAGSAISWTEAMTLKADGLVGIGITNPTASFADGNGVQFNPIGEVIAQKSGGVSLYLNRTNSSGSARHAIAIYENTSAMGYLGMGSGSEFAIVTPSSYISQKIGNETDGIQYSSSGTYHFGPWISKDGSIDLGRDAARWKDLYLENVTDVDVDSAYLEFFKYKYNGQMRYRVAHSETVSDSFGSGRRTFLGDGGGDVYVGTGNGGLTPSNSYIALNHSGEISLGAGSSPSKDLVIGTDGSVTTPNQPSAAFSTNSNITLTGNSVWSTISLNYQYYDYGSCYDTSTYEFTAPVTGRYLYCANMQLENNSSITWMYIFPSINGSHSPQSNGFNYSDFTPTGLYWTQATSMVLLLDAGDTVTIDHIGSGGSSTLKAESTFSITLIS